MNVVLRNMKKINFLSLLFVFGFVSNVAAKQIDTNIGVIQAMDKITGRVSTIEIPVGGEVEFGDFKISLKSCKTTPPEEAPENFAFVNIIEKLKDDKTAEVFNGWMISSSPALHEVQHPVYDVWLIKCINGDLSKFEKKDDKKEVSDQVEVKKEDIKTEEVKPVQENKKEEKVKTEPVKKEIKEEKPSEKKVEKIDAPKVETPVVEDVKEKSEEVVYSSGVGENKEEVKVDENEVVYTASEKIEKAPSEKLEIKTSEVVYGGNEKAE